MSFFFFQIFRHSLTDFITLNRCSTVFIFFLWAIAILGTLLNPLNLQAWQTIFGRRDPRSKWLGTWCRREATLSSTTPTHRRNLRRRNIWKLASRLRSPPPRRFHSASRDESLCVCARGREWWGSVQSETPKYMKITSSRIYGKNTTSSYQQRVREVSNTSRSNRGQRVICIFQNPFRSYHNSG